MIERFFSKTEKPEESAKNRPPEEKFAKPQEQSPEESQTEQKAEKQESIETEYAKELENTPKGGFRKKLTKIAAAFALAGYLMGAGEAIAPEATEESKGVYDIDYTRENQPDLYKKILEQIKQTGGVKMSPQLPETTYRPRKIAKIAEHLAAQSEEPFYNNSKVILGEKFVKDNPEGTKDYMEKISTAIKATVRIAQEGSIGSGVIVKTENKKFILTNAHVCEGGDEAVVTFNDHRSFVLKVKARDEKNDIAMIDIPETLESILTNTEALELEKKQDSDFWHIEERVVSVGNPLGFPSAVGICKRTIVPGEKGVFYYPDERFKNLELYKLETYKIRKEQPANTGIGGISGVNVSGTPLEIEKDEKIFQKTGAIPGMSGGPLISLDKKGRPELIGLVQAYREYKTNPEATLGVAVPAEKIREFLEEKGTKQINTNTNSS